MNAIRRKTHEAVTERKRVAPGSDRAFGFVFTVVLLVLAVWPVTGGQALNAWALSGSVVLLLIALVLPKILAPLNRLWFRFGTWLHRIVTPLVMGLIFLLAVIPVCVH